jgi:hypothetical protein
MDALAVRQDFLKEALRLAERVDLSREEFQELCNRAQELLELTDQEISDALLVSRPTYNRWKNGKNLPHRAARRALVSWTKDRLFEKLKRLNSIASQRSGGAGGRGAVSVMPMAAKGR